ncbi:hypothetical protein COCCADRAFT_29839 [Bipolaris zeicola 26-R-13]|uniref:Cytochrome P450 monooxygenase n=1 Tax=Cochliobolus carbonum (strain 26-R-13) TaxID=930089 RepID=W6YCW4_COCC2|nr:uncharacterized protein COCCADRAFT_29839 [Bipolaris zeicola 26-R-13]EUC29006.1 hypothetical protein COCCADRAFT_29839 [Bipolaris zeicola 26-R-13]
MALESFLAAYHLQLSPGIGIAIAVILLYCVLSRSGQQPFPDIPVASLEKGLWRCLPRRLKPPEFLRYGNSLMQEGRRMTTGCFQVHSGAGFKIVVPNRFSHELRNHPALSLSKGQKKEFPTQYAGFEGMREGLRDDRLMLDVINAKLTPSLGLLTGLLVHETSRAVEHTLGEKSGWEGFEVKDVAIDITARVSGHVFVGEQLARNDNWLAISKEYTIRIFGNGVVLNFFPPFLRAFMYQILPPCRQLRKQVQDARKLLEPEAQKIINQRKESKNKVESSTENAAGNCFAWMLDIAKGRPLDFTGGQLLLSLAAMNTTTEVITRCLLQICDTPEILQPLRGELIEVLTGHGWTRSALQKLRLMDSFLREVLRVHPLASAPMTRYVSKPIILSDGTTLPAGGLILISDDHTRGASAFSNPETFDLHRFYRQGEQTGKEGGLHFVTTSAEHLQFGHGQHACPGRFFVSDQLKVLIAFYILKYDFRYEPGTSRLPVIEYEQHFIANPANKIQAKIRREELDFLSPKVL